MGKLWREKLDKRFLWILTYVQSLIDLYCFEEDQFKIVEDITSDNCADFWKVILKQYQYYNLKLYDLEELGDALKYYFSCAHTLEFAEYLVYPISDRRNLALYIDSYLQTCAEIILLPDDVPKLIEYLDTPIGNVKDARATMDKYLEQFTSARHKEGGKRLVAIKKDRLEALEKNLPIPIKPMSIKLNPCLRDHKK